MRLALTLLCLIVTWQVDAQLPQGCQCTPAEPSEGTRPGANEIVTVVEERPVTAMEGVVRDVNGEALEGVLIEVFDRPEWILKQFPSVPAEHTRLVACITGATGRFCFAGMVAGEYEVRASLGTGWNRTHVYVVVEPSNPKARTKGIELEMTVGT